MKIVKKAIAKRWQIVSEDSNAVKRWIPKSIAVDTAATKPDLTLLQETASKDIMVRIVDFTVVNEDEDNFEQAAIAKVRKYEPIKHAIEQRANSERWGREVSVQIVPVVVGTLGVILNNWHETMAKLLIPSDEADTIAKTVSCEAIKGSKWIWNQYNMKRQDHAGL